MTIQNDSDQASDLSTRLSSFVNTKDARDGNRKGFA